MKLIKGMEIIADKYVLLDLIIDKYQFETILIYISDDIPEEIKIEGHKVKDTRSNNRSTHYGRTRNRNMKRRNSNNSRKHNYI